uniref:Uncharacterized protein n=1 Tax=Trichobilharzia regenti TaxID=157069 RepID=A0AA85KLU9_TRIRE|nr:unnamed protein product [Trichobilharzia regenti]
MCVDDTVLEKFVSENDSSFSLGNVEMKTKEIILERCRRVLESDSSSDLYICLSCIRILTRDEISRKELTSDFFLSQLLKYAFPYGAGSQCCRINIEALKSLSNIIFKETYVISRLKLVVLICCYTSGNWVL